MLHVNRTITDISVRSAKFSALSKINLKIQNTKKCLKTSVTALQHFNAKQHANSVKCFLKGYSFIFWSTN